MNNENSIERTECTCDGRIATCLYCQGTGFVNQSQRLEADRILANSRVMQCASCGQQNRVMNERLHQSDALLCLRCHEPLLRSSGSLASLLRKPS